MLAIINNLEPFFIDNYRRINIREFARIKKISPPYASKLLDSFEKEGLLIKEKDRNYIFYSANKDSKEFIEFSRVYWFKVFKKIGLIDYLEKEFINPTIILFGSFSKAEIKQDSDIDLAVFTPTDKIADFDFFEKKLKRKIQLFVFRSRGEIKNKDLLDNILNGFIVSGGR